jgi:hypothetical protein
MNDIFDFKDRMVTYISGQSGSGKTNLILWLLINKFRFFYDYIFLFHGDYESDEKYHILNIPDKHIFDKYTEEALEKILLLAEHKHTEDKDFKMLIIFDDCIASGSLHEDGKNQSEQLRRLFFNSRRIGVSTIISTQIVLGISPQYREQINYFIFFQPYTKHEYNHIEDMVMNVNIRDKKHWRRLFNFVFDKDYNFMFVKRRKNVIYKNFNKVNF